MCNCVFVVVVVGVVVRWIFLFHLPYSIEHFHQVSFTTLSGEKAHIRDCSDDNTFGFPKDKKDRYKVLINMASDNETKCAWDGGEMICLTKCNSTNFCNGPQLAASTNQLSLVVLIVNLLLYHYICV